MMMQMINDTEPLTQELPDLLMVDLSVEQLNSYVDTFGALMIKVAGDDGYKVC